jgi:hypothetical protein
MRQLPFLLPILGLLFGTVVLDGHGEAPRKKEAVETLMKKKLVRSQNLLEGLARHDFEKIAENGEELLAISKRTQWKVSNTRLYMVYSNEFQSNVEDLVKNARKKNVDATALSYVALTLTCVKCHKHVREK